MGIRRKGRELALQILFQLDINSQEVDETLATFWLVHPAPDKIRVFAEELVRGTMSQLGTIDDYVTKYALHWKLTRMPVVDRNILRFAIYELLFREDIPTKVTINEAVEIAKKYGSVDSSKFINGMLDKIAQPLSVGADTEEK